MAAHDLVPLLPFLILAGTSVVALIAAAFFRGHRLVASLSMGGLFLAGASLPAVPRISAEWPARIGSLFIIDGYSLFYNGLLAVSGLVTAALSYGYLRKKEGQREEYYILLVLATLGGGALASATHFASFVLGLEVLSVSLYVLVGYLRLDERSLEAGLKYLILASASVAVLLFGLALIYAGTGSMDLDVLAREVRTESPGWLFLAGISLALVGLGFKLALVPFHLWTPDVYEGAPAPVTAFVATASKGAVFAIVLRYLAGPIEGRVWQALAVLAALSMVVGTLLALLQKNVKRILAYSSIAHLGYLLVALLAGGEAGARAASFYLTAYVVTGLGAFGAVTVLSGPERDAESLEDFRGLFWRRPGMATVFAASLLSLAGIPLTGGFLGKFYVVVAGVGSSLWILSAVLVASSAAGLYYYLRILVSLYQESAAERIEKDRVPAVKVSWGEGAVLGALLVLLFWMGVYPGPFLTLIQNALAGAIR